MRRPRGPWVWAVAWLALGCLKVDVTTNVEPGARFSHIETFAHAPQSPTPPPPGRGLLVRDAVTEQIEVELTAKGYRRAPLEQAQIVVAFQARGINRQRLRDAGDPDANFYVVRDYIEGTLVIDVFYTGETRPVWHGVGTVDVEDERNAEAAARRAVEAILAEFPPDAG